MKTQATSLSRNAEPLRRKPTKRAEPTLERLLGQGAHLWQSDEEFEAFLADIYRRRREDARR